MLHQLQREEGGDKEKPPVPVRVHRVELGQHNRELPVAQVDLQRAQARHELVLLQLAVSVGVDRREGLGRRDAAAPEPGQDLVGDVAGQGPQDFGGPAVHVDLGVPAHVALERERAGHLAS